MKIWQEHRTVRRQQVPFEQSQKTLDLLDTRTMQLANSAKSGADFVRKGLRPLKWTGSAKCADLSKLIEDGPGDYIFNNSLPDRGTESAVKILLEILRLLKAASCDVNDPVAEAGLTAVKDRVTKLVCEYERYFPRSEVCRVSHIMLHVCDVIHRWNNVRNFWCFLTERYKPAFLSIRLYPCSHGYSLVNKAVAVAARL